MAYGQTNASMAKADDVSTGLTRRENRPDAENDQTPYYGVAGHASHPCGNILLPGMASACLTAGNCFIQNGMLYFILRESALRSSFSLPLSTVSHNAEAITAALF